MASRRAIACIVLCILAISSQASASKRGVIVQRFPHYWDAGWDRELYSRSNVEWKMDEADLSLMKNDAEEMGGKDVLYREYLEGEDTEESIDAGATIGSHDFRPFLRKKPNSSWFAGVEIDVFDIEGKQHVGSVDLGNKDYYVFARYPRQRKQMQKGDVLGKGFAQIRPLVDLRRHMRLRPDVIYRVCLNLTSDFYENLVNAGPDDVDVKYKCGYFKIVKASDREKKSKLFYKVGSYQFDNQNFEEAMTLYSRALIYNPENYMARSRLAMLIESKGARERNLEYLEIARKMFKSMTQLGKKGGLCWEWMRCVDIEREMRGEERSVANKIRRIKDEIRRKRKCKLIYGLSATRLVGESGKVFFYPWEKFGARIRVRWNPVRRRCSATLREGRGWFDNCELVVASRDSGREVYRGGLDLEVKKGFQGTLTEKDIFVGLVKARLDGAVAGRYVVRMLCEKKKTLAGMEIEAEGGFEGLVIADGGGRQEIEIVVAKSEEEKLLEVFHRAWWKGMWTEEAEKILSYYLAEHGDNRDLLSLLLRLNLEKGDFDEAEAYRSRPETSALRLLQA